MATVVRCSNLDSLLQCPASILANGPGLIRISTSGEAANLGKAVHDCCATLVPSGVYNIDEAAERYGLSEESRADATKLLFYATKAWVILSRYFNPDPNQRIVEAAATGPILSGAGMDYQVAGTIDLCSPIDKDKAIFLDWKSGYLDDGFHGQMTGYAYLLWNHMGRPEQVSITGVVVFLRHRYWRVVRYNADTLNQWEHDLVHNHLSRPDCFRPGRACPHCELFASCQARQAVSIQTIREVLGGDSEHPDKPGWWDRAKAVLSQLTVDNKGEPVVGETIAEVIFRIRMLSTLIESAKGVLRESLKQVGPIPLGDGIQLGMREIEVEKLKPEAAIPILRNYLSDGQLASAMTLSLPKILTIYANSRVGEKGWKRAQARNELLKMLQDSGAVMVLRQERMEERHEDPNADPQTEEKEINDGNDESEHSGEGAKAG